MLSRYNILYFMIQVAIFTILEYKFVYKNIKLFGSYEQIDSGRNSLFYKITGNSTRFNIRSC